MGVKSLTIVLDDEGTEICVLQRSIDGYLSGHGEDLKRVLRGHVITREYRSKDHSKAAVSMEHLAVLLIKDFRWGVGFSELLPCGTRDRGEDYVYTVYPRHTSPKLPSLLNLRVEAVFPKYTGPDLNKESTRTVIYDGLLDEFIPNEVQETVEYDEARMDELIDFQKQAVQRQVDPIRITTNETSMRVKRENK